MTPDEAGWLAELTEQLACPTCRPDPAPVVVDLPPAAVRARRHRRRRDRARGQGRGRASRRAGCWRCGEAEWVASARAVFADDQAQAAVEAQRVDELHAAHRATLRRLARAERRLGYVQTWHDRVAGVVEAMPTLTKTGSRGRLQLKQGPAGRARPLWLIADFYARMAADRAARGLSGRGRPPQHPLVVGVMAIAADPAAGRRSMAGLHPSAAFAGVTAKTVSTAWAYSERVGATVRREVGRTCSLAEREETGLRRRRSVYDFAPLHTSPFDPTPHLGAAATVVARLLQRAVQLVDEHQGAVEEARRAVAAAEAAVLDAHAVVAERTAEDLRLQAGVSAEWLPDARQAVTAAVAARARATRAAAPPVDVRAVVDEQRAARATAGTVVATVASAFDLAERMANFYHPPRMGSRKRSSSGLRGLFFSAQPTSPLAGARRPDGRGEEQNGGASRPAPAKGVAGPTAPARPRTTKRSCAGSPARPRRSEAMAWAKPLAAGLARRWEFVARFLDDANDGRRNPRAVARERGLRLAMLAATLAPRLSRHWTAGDVVRLVERHGLAGPYAEARTVIGAGDAHSPLRYLATVLDRALTNPAAAVPHPSPVRQAFERDVLAAERAAQADRTTALRTALAERDQAAAAERAGAGTARHAALAAARAAGRGDHAAARAIAAADEWPAVTQPGTGLAPDLDH
ncbi:hypothetical protein [Micromonospora sp. RV43]|uniref:hypothetical protein n=1 Tax=Micromonospora sp. RV43 TaxID=1661387 RepID=UPI001F1B7A53|nr:hypothetical protein [Micromonospora sp. RV43]